MTLIDRVLHPRRRGTGLEPDPGVGEPAVAARLNAATAEAPTLPTTAHRWPLGPVLDQGGTSACAGFATTAELIADPVGQRDISVKVGNDYGLNHYQRARVLVGHPPMPSKDSSFQGSTISGNLDAAVERNLITGYRKLGSVEEVASVVVNDGPVVLGVRWIRSFESPSKSGLMPYKPDTPDRGYHAITIVGYDPAKVLPRPPERRRGRWVERPDHAPEPLFLVRNSWGDSWGAMPRRGWRMGWYKANKLPLSGDGWLRVRDLRHLWDAGHAYGYAIEGRLPVDLAAVLAAHPDPTQP